MRVLVCPTAFKGSLGAVEVASAMARGVRRALPAAEVRELPLSDGGPGLVEAISAGEDGRVETTTVTGPLGEPVEGRILWTAADEALLESADACGLHLLPDGGKPLEAHTRGVGELAERALERGAARLRIGLGGSGTTDGGTGMARVFGYRFLDEQGRELPAGGGSLRRLARIEPGERPAGGEGREIVGLADVETPLTGMRGAARTFGPQKGATAEEVELLVDGLERLAGRLVEDLDRDVAGLAGSGAAGGLGAGCAAFLGARLVPGARWVLRRLGFDRRLREADLVLTGEGAYDASSRAGKITSAVLRRCRDAGVPAVLVAGRIEGEVPGPARGVDGGGELLGPADLETLAARALEER